MPTNDLVLAVHNLHAESCGAPPNLVQRLGGPYYVGYFQNACGEQFVVEIDRQTKRGTLHGGDLGWKYSIEIENNRVLGSAILGEDEIAWLKLTWKTATGDELRVLDLKQMAEGAFTSFLQSTKTTLRPTPNWIWSYGHGRRCRRSSNPASWT